VNGVAREAVGLLEDREVMWLHKSYGSGSMLSEAQLAHLEHLVHSINAELHIEEATLDIQQTLTLVLCNDTTCFRPLYMTAQDIDIAAALAGQPRAQHALQEWLRSALQGMVL
jgi:hypothetical protein